MNATPIIALHGFLGSPAAFEGLSAALGPRRVYALHLPGHGPGPAPVPNSFATVADQLFALIETQIGTRPFDLVGYSLGARLALALLAQDPGRVRRAVLISVSPGLRDEASRLARRTEDEAAARLLELEGLPAFVAAWEARPLFATQRELPLVVQEAERHRRLTHDPHGVAMALRRLSLAEMPDYRAVITRHAPRLALVTGARDDKFCALARQLAAEAPVLRHELIADAGHNPLLEAPQQMTARITALLDASPTLPHSSAASAATKEPSS